MYIIRKSMHDWMQSPPATLVAQIDRGPDFARPDESLCAQATYRYPQSHYSCALGWISAWLRSSSFFESLPGSWNRGVYEQEAWNDVSFVGTVYLQLESVFHQLIGGVVARLCRARGSLLATDLIARNNRTRSLIFPYTSNITSVHVRVEINGRHWNLRL